MRESIRDAKVSLLTELNKATTLLIDANEKISTADGLPAVLGRLKKLFDDTAVLNEKLARRVGALESHGGALAGKVHLHEKVFRALGADLMLRATGGSSVAPAAPIENPPNG
jgi:hypothetical protein